MYGYEVVLESPTRDEQIGLRFLSREHHSSVTSLLRAKGVYRKYSSWHMLSFRVAHAPTLHARPVEVDRLLPAPGTIISVFA